MFNSKMQPTRQIRHRLVPLRRGLQFTIGLALMATVNAHLHARYNGSFVDIRPVAGLETPPGLQFADEILDDGRTLLFSFFNGEGFLYEATRESIYEPFDSTMRFDELSQAGRAVSGQTISSDGLTTYFLAGELDGTASTPWSAERERREDNWSNPQETEIDSSAIRTGSLTLSDDDLTMYYSANQGGKDQLFQVKRETVDGPFADPEPISELNVSNADRFAPTVSKDELAILFSEVTGHAQVRNLIATRSSTDEPFGDPIDLDDFGLGSRLNSRFEYSGFPVISPNWPEDGSKLYFTGNPGGFALYEATWNVYADGDANLDDVVNFADFLILSENFGQDGAWREGDFDGDGSVAFPDFLALSANFGGAANASAAAVPEPTGLAIALFGLLGLIGFRKRR